MKGKIKIYDEPIAWTNDGTYKNLQKVINSIPKGEEFLQIENSVTHLHLVTRKIPKGKKLKNYKYIIYHEPIAFTLNGTYKNLKRAVNQLPEDEEFVQICTTPTHIHVISKKQIK